MLTLSFSTPLSCLLISFLYLLIASLLNLNASSKKFLLLCKSDYALVGLSNTSALLSFTAGVESLVEDLGFKKLITF